MQTRPRTFQVKISKASNHLSKPKGDPNPSNNEGLLDSTTVAAVSAEISLYTQEQKGILKV